MDGHDKGNGGQKRAASVVNANRITVALPFSKIAMEESSEDLRDLAALVADVADALAKAVGDDETAGLRLRARTLNHRLNG